MKLVVWDTRDPLDPSFEAAWCARIARAPGAHFALDLRYLAWNAKNGQHARTALVEDASFGAVLALREQEGRFVSGWPWRWQAAVEGPERTAPPFVTEDEARRLFDAARELAAGRRLRCFLPYPPPPGVAAFEGGRTIFHSVQHADEEMLAAMDKDKQRIIRRAGERGYRVVDADGPELWRGFAEVQEQTRERHGKQRRAVPDSPSPGLAWREWELPWMHLQVAVREGSVESGLGYGITPGALCEGRTGASTIRARREGAFPLVVYEGARWARGLGYRFINSGGDTFFKRDTIGRLGVTIATYVWLGGGALWAPANHAEAWWRRTRPRVTRLVRNVVPGSSKRG